MVVLENVPWHTARAWQEHADALLREALLALWEAGADVDPRLAQVSAAGEAFAELAAALDAAAADAGGPGATDRVDLVLAPSPDGVASFLALGPALDGATELARQGLLLAPAPPPRARAFREWVIAQVAAQVLGAPASAWRDPL
jgi:hypothetical protein